MPVWVRRILWSRASVEHIARHGVVRDEVEQVCFSDWAGSRVGRRLYRVIGRTQLGRYLTIYLSPRQPGAYYVVTARNATTGERRLARRQR